MQKLPIRFILQKTRLKNCGVATKVWPGKKNNYRESWPKWRQLGTLYVEKIALETDNYFQCSWNLLDFYNFLSKNYQKIVGNQNVLFDRTRSLR